MRIDTAGWVVFSLAAAALKLPSFALQMKVSRSRVFMVLPKIAANGFP